MVFMTKRSLLASVLFLLFSLSLSAGLHAQAIPAGRGGAHLVAGGFVSAYSPDYGPNHLLGVCVTTHLPHNVNDRG